MDCYVDLDWEEAWDYQPGFVVELKAEPGALHTVDSYDPMMVPPVWLTDDPKPRYPHELRVISRSTLSACPLPSQTVTSRQMCSL
jgi:hypothetical protein